MGKIKAKMARALSSPRFMSKSKSKSKSQLKPTDGAADVLPDEKTAAKDTTTTDSEPATNDEPTINDEPVTNDEPATNDTSAKDGHDPKDDSDSSTYEGREYDPYDRRHPDQIASNAGTTNASTYDARAMRFNQKRPHPFCCSNIENTYKSPGIHLETGRIVQFVKIKDQEEFRPNTKTSGSGIEMKVSEAIINMVLRLKVTMAGEIGKARYFELGTRKFTEIVPAVRGLGMD